MKWFVLLFLALANAVSLPAAAAGGQVETIAGDGQLGLADGPAERAQFLAPSGMARGGDGTIYISDEAGQRIRALSRGTVRTIAGSGAIGVLGMSVAGGYRDGAGAQAQFRHPRGLAIGPDGNLYVADAGNGCIRKIDLAHDIVSTLVCKPLSSPLSISFDATGALWIADFGIGLRRFAQGVVETIPLRTGTVIKAISVSVSPDADNPQVMVTTPQTLCAYTIETKIDYCMGYLTGGNGRPFGNPDEVLAIGEGQILFTDLVTSTVRYLRLPTFPFVTQPDTNIIAGTDRERGENNAGFIDGPPEKARFDEPRGIVIDGNHILIADAGNKRIRSFPLPHFRLPESGFAHDYDDKHYEIAFVGPSYIFWDSYDDVSVCGAIEQRLNASAKFSKPVRCHSVRMDSAPVPAVLDYITTYLSVQPHIDLVIIETPPGQAAYSGFRASLDNVQRALEPTGAHVMMAWWWYRQTFSDGEDLLGREQEAQSFPDDSYAMNQAIMASVTKSLEGSPYLQYNMFEDFYAYEKAGGLPLYGVPDSHMNQRGNVFLGNHIADFLLKNLNALGAPR